MRQKSYCREFEENVFDVDVTTENGRVRSYPGMFPWELHHLIFLIEGDCDPDEPIDVHLSRLADEYDATTRQTAKLLNVPPDSFRALIGGPDLKIIRPDLDAVVVRGCVWGTAQFRFLFRTLYKEVGIEFLEWIQDRARPEWEQEGWRVKPDGLLAKPNHWGIPMTVGQVRQLQECKDKNGNDLGPDPDDPGFDKMLGRLFVLKGGFGNGMAACRKQARFRKNIRGFPIEFVKRHQMQSSQHPANDEEVGGIKDVDQPRPDDDGSHE